jgi:hypothetical protein
MDDQVQRVGDVALDGAGGKLHFALEHAGGEPAECLGGRVGVDGGESAGVPRTANSPLRR